MKRTAGNIDATPSKKIYSSIIADYSLRTGICELVDNAIDQWARNGRAGGLNISVAIELGQQSITVEDNAGGVERDALGVMVTPGSGLGTGTEETIGIFGVGTKRAVVALAQHVRIRTRRGNGKTYLVEYDDHWLEDSTWDLPVYEVDAIAKASTIIELSRLRFRIDERDVSLLEEHLQATYALFLGGVDVTLSLNGTPLSPHTFENWTYPPDYRPRRFKGVVPTEDGDNIRFMAIGGLINERGSIAGEYGVYFYCNDRLIARGLKTVDVGFIAGLAGAPHNVVSLVRVIVFLNGPAQCMPWNSSKSAINVNHVTFKTIQQWLMNTVSGFANVCKRLHGEWDEKVFRYKSGSYVEEDIRDFEKVQKRFLPKLPTKRLNYGLALQKANLRVLKKKPWAQGIVEADAAVELIRHQRFDQKNRLALILLDSTLEIAYKDFLVNESGKHYTDAALVALFAARHQVENEVKKHINISPTLWKKLKFYYGLRCKLVHERAAAGISDGEIEDFRAAAHKVMSKLFKLKWLKDA
jgi:hypothetical protein